MTKPSRYAVGLPARVTESDSRPKIPEFCDVDGCQTRYLGKGRGNARGFADVVFTTADGAFIARCSEHYLRHLYRAGRGKDCDISGRDWQISLDDLREYRANIPEGNP